MQKSLKLKTILFMYQRRYYSWIGEGHDMIINSQTDRGYKFESCHCECNKCIVDMTHMNDYLYCLTVQWFQPTFENTFFSGVLYLNLHSSVLPSGLPLDLERK